ncbi:hypothetical protein SAY87_015636 [Trapa incisa]|uniref:Uncharacterized protein n=1 Tax=Trapa incisa TaxID=236973 RepID=A0AAN7LDK0_9MYRT|nr:hypothetical protein SAY87_015636 [Trapa incisa]
MQNGGASAQSHQQGVSFTVDPDRMSELEGQITELPTLLSRTAGRSSCCIFRVPPSLLEINPRAYQPHIVSIGPFYHGNDRFKMIQEHKWRFLGDLIDRTGTQSRPRKVSIADLFQIITPMEESIRDCYSEPLKFDSRDLMEMIVLDGCFIIELFCKVGRIVPTEMDEPLFNMAWILPFLMRDLLRLENQIPYFVLKSLFDLCVGNFSIAVTNIDSSSNTNSTEDNISSSSLAKLALVFFNYMVQRPVKVLEKYYDSEGKHLLDLFRLIYVSPSQEKVPKKPSKFLRLIQSAKKLHLAGVKFEPRKTESFLDIDFKDGVLKIPVLTIDDFSSSLFLNFVAYEQCYSHCSKYVTAYATFMGCLINTPGDAGLLCDHKIVENYFGTDDEVARFFNNVGKDVVFDIHRSYLSTVFEEVNEYYRNNWHVRWAEFKHRYFDTPWSFISALAALLLLILTAIQAFFAAYAYFIPPNK